jgi:hypothetical protein
MSTKTTFKRIALVAVASLGFGMLSVAPSKAAVFAYTTSVGTITPADGSAVVGSTITIPLVLDTAAVNTVTSTAVFTASFVRVPNNSARVSANLVAGSVTRTGTTNATNLTNAASATTTQAVPTGNTIVVSSGATNAPQLVAAPAGEFSFVADVPGVYQVSILGAVATPDVGTPTFTNTATTAITIIVGGAQLTQATGGLGTATGTATTGGSAVFAYTMPGATAAAARFNVTSTGVGSISNPQDCATDSTDLTNASGAVRCTTGGSTTEGFANGVNTADGLFFNNTTLSAGNVLIGPSAQTVFTVDAASAVAGVQTITVTSIALATGVPTTRATITITWGANPTASTSLTQVWAAQGSTRPTALETTALRLPSTAGVAASSTGTSVVAIAVNVFSGENTALNSVPVSATISGPGLISITSGAGNAAAGTARSVALTGTAQAATHQSIIGVSGDGTRGVATITISSGTTVLATKTVTFYGAVATLTATQGVSVMRSGRTATSTVADFTLGGVDPTLAATSAIGQATATNITIVAKDVDGNTVPLTSGAVTADISDSAVIGAVNIAACLSGTHASTTVCAAGDGTWIANTVAAIGGVSGAAATVTFKTAHPTLPATFISAVVPFTLGGSKTGGTVTMKLDKTTYEPGERVIITYTAKDAAGNPVHDWAAVGTPASNKSMVGINGTGVFVNGSHIYGDGTTELTYAPTAPGPFTVTLSTGTATGATITASATVADDAATTAAAAAGDAAAEATDAANAATDAANAAAEAADAATAAAQDAADAVAALSTSVTAMVDALRKQITSLTNLVIKIQKKVRA